MNDKEMTETEIMKELQSAAEWFTEHGRNTNTAIIGICERAVDLIKDKNNQVKIYKKLLDKAEAEIDRLTAIEESHREQNGELRKEVERLTINMNAFGLGMKRESERADTARAEAIKEYVERLHIAFRHYNAKDELTKEIFLNIANLSAKEMGVEL